MALSHQTRAKSGPKLTAQVGFQSSLHGPTLDATETSPQTCFLYQNKERIVTNREACGAFPVLTGLMSCFHPDGAAVMTGLHGRDSSEQKVASRFGG